MRAVRRKDTEASSFSTAAVLLSELREECEHVAALVRRLESSTVPVSEQERDEIFGELSAAIVHLHVHTAGLDELLCEGE